MKKRFFTALLTLILMIPWIIPTVSADMGPKPSTTITVHGGGGERMVLTLLAEKEKWGPNWRIEPGEKPASYMASNKIQEKAWYVFRDYADPDGFCFWGEVFDNGVRWGYYPPEVFKVAVYYPDYDVLWVSAESFERYAFQSDYRLILPAVGENAQSGILDMDLKRETDAAEEVFGLLIRIVLTIAIELGIARVFGFDSKRQRRLVMRVNLVTQIGLNVLLWLWYFFDGPLMAMLRLFLAELVVLGVETVIYLRALREGEGAGRTIGYAFSANAASVLIGLLLLA